MPEVGVISLGKAVSEEPHLRVLANLSRAYVWSPLGDRGKAAKIACRHGSCPIRCRSTQARRQTHVERISQPPDGRSALAFATDPQGSIQLVARPSNDRFMTPSSRSSPQTQRSPLGRPGAFPAFVRNRRSGRTPAEDWSRGGSDSSQTKCLLRGADNAAANYGLD
jgi:hypothetical protein